MARLHRFPLRSAVFAAVAGVLALSLTVPTTAQAAWGGGGGWHGGGGWGGGGGWHGGGGWGWRGGWGGCCWGGGVFFGFAPPVY